MQAALYKKLDAKSILSWSFIAFFIFYYACYIVRHSDFNNDDLDNFLPIGKVAFWHFLWMPINVHLVPGHRLLSWMVYRFAPMNFAVSVAVLMLCHVAALFYLNKIMRLMRAGDAGRMILCTYACSALIVFGLVWWAHAQHRAPYVFLDLFSIYQYLAWLDDRRRGRLCLIFVAALSAYAFYEMAVFIPLHMLIYGWLARDEAFKQHFWRTVRWPLFLLVLAGIYALFFIHEHSSDVLSVSVQALRDHGSDPNVAKLLVDIQSASSSLQVHMYLLMRSLRSDFEFAKMLVGAIFGLSLEGSDDFPIDGMSIHLALTCGVLIALVLYGLWKAPSTWRIVLSGLLLVLVSYLPITLSVRGTVLGSLATHQYRFYYEELHLVALFAGLWCSRVFARGPIVGNHNLRWAAGAVLVVAYAGLNLFNLQESARTPFSALSVMNVSHNYMRNLRHGLDRIPDPNPTFENNSVPPYMSIFGTVRETRILVPLFVPGARFDGESPARYRVEIDGHVEHIN